MTNYRPDDVMRKGAHTADGRHAMHGLDIIGYLFMTAAETPFKREARSSIPGIYILSYKDMGLRSF